MRLTNLYCLFKFKYVCKTVVSINSIDVFPGQVTCVRLFNMFKYRGYLGTCIYRSGNDLIKYWLSLRKNPIDVWLATNMYIYIFIHVIIIIYRG